MRQVEAGIPDLTNLLVQRRGSQPSAVTLSDLSASTAGTGPSTKDKGVIDETPGAYKDIDAVMAAQVDLVEIVHTLKQVVCVKG